MTEAFLTLFPLPIISSRLYRKGKRANVVRLSFNANVHEWANDANKSKNQKKNILEIRSFAQIRVEKY